MLTKYGIADFIDMFGKKRNNFSFFLKKNCIFAKRTFKKDNKMNNINVKKMEDCQGIGVVYDISLDGTVVNALGMNVISNTDG